MKKSSDRYYLGELSIISAKEGVFYNYNKLK
ncbi:hypothetical protein pEaSNUABM6_00138 [Erwinia phage pEa_SNUABM_6]|nr:hypothetical protein pEaSNUABM6_00138 [Erwinia phage pEa_SNUABM_6]